jgi:hypothetical protein
MTERVSLSGVVGESLNVLRDAFDQGEAIPLALPNIAPRRYRVERISVNGVLNRALSADVNLVAVSDPEKAFNQPVVSVMCRSMEFAAEPDYLDPGEAFARFGRPWSSYGIDEPRTIPSYAEAEEPEEPVDAVIRPRRFLRDDSAV